MHESIKNYLFEICSLHSLSFPPRLSSSNSPLSAIHCPPPTFVATFTGRSRPIRYGWPRRSRAVRIGINYETRYGSVNYPFPKTVRNVRLRPNLRDSLRIRNEAGTRTVYVRKRLFYNTLHFHPSFDALVFLLMLDATLLESHSGQLK